MESLHRFVLHIRYGVKSLDAPTYLAVALIVPAVSLVAAYLPARRATAVDPMAALRSE